MIRNIPGFPPIVTKGDEVTSSPKAPASELPTVESAKAAAVARQTQVLNYTRQRSAQSPLKLNLRTDGPTMEQWIEAGYKPENYPPEGYAELDSPALTEYKAKAAATLNGAPDGEHKPHSVNDDPQVQK
jgi:hypothetical protein